MEILALLHLGFDNDEIKKINHNYKEADKVMREILMRWQKKSTKNTAEVCHLIISEEYVRYLNQLNYYLEFSNKIF